MAIVSAGMFAQGAAYQNVSALLFVIVCIVLLISYFKDELVGIETLILMPIVTNLTFLILNNLFNDGNVYFANFDTLNNFYPKAELIINRISEGDFFVIPKTWSEKYILFDLINAPIMYWKGKHEFSFVLLLSFYRSLTVLIIYMTGKHLWSIKYARLACLLFIFNPLYIIHSSLIFKEAWIQLLFGSFFYCLVRLIDKPANLKYLVLLLLLSIICVWERMYLAVPVFFSLIPCILVFWRADRKLYVIFFALSLFAVLFFSATLLSDVNNFYDYLVSVRNFYSTYEDVNQRINYGQGYIFSIVKLFLSPYPNPRKLIIFTELSCLIFWGAFWGAFINLSALAGLFYGSIKNVRVQASAALIISYVCIVGFIAPYGFRQRDAIAVVFVLWAAFALIQFSEKIKARKIKDN